MEFLPQSAYSNVINHVKLFLHTSCEFSGMDSTLLLLPWQWIFYSQRFSLISISCTFILRLHILFYTIM